MSSDLLALSHAKGIGNKTLIKVARASYELKTSVFDAFKALFTSKYLELDLSQLSRLANEQISHAHEKSHFIISILDSEYPDALLASVDPPALLFCAGDVKLLHQQSITIIGTREPSSHGLEISRRITRWFVEKQWVITSGLAHGIDTSVHLGCLDAKGKTIAVLAHGLEKIYPAKNKDLAERILDNGGLLITEYKYNSYVAKSNFIKRDAIQAAISKAVVLIQSGVNGGSLHASKAALENHRYLVVAAQSRTDRIRGFANSEANFILLEKDVEAKISLLKTSKEKINYILSLESAEHLDDVEETIRNLTFTSQSVFSNSLL